MRLSIKTPTREFEYSARDGASSIVIGNRSYDDICVSDDPALSGPHVRLEQFIGRWSFSDQFSNAGTLHNGTRKSSGELAVGDVLTLGATSVTIAALTADAAAAAPATHARDSSGAPGAIAKPTASDPMASGTASTDFAANASTAFDAAPREPDTLSTAELESFLFQALVVAARREDGLDLKDPEAMGEYRNLAAQAVRNTTPQRIMFVYAPLLLTGEALNFDIEDEIKGELEADAGDINGSLIEIYNFLLAEGSRLAGHDLSNEPLARERLADAASDAANALHTADTAEVHVPWLSATSTGPVHLCICLGRLDGSYHVAATRNPPGMPTPPAAVEMPADAAPAAPAAAVNSSAPAGRQANDVFVQRVADFLFRDFQNQYDLNIRNDPSASKRVQEAANKAVIELEAAKTTQVNLPFLASDASGPKHLQVEVQRRHLHERAESEQAPHRTEPAPRNGSSSANKKNNVAATIIVISIMVLAVGGAVIGVVMDELSSANTQAEFEARFEEQQARLKATEDMRKALREATRNDSPMPPEEQLKLVKQMQASAKASGIGLESEFSNAITSLQSRIYAVLAKRYNAVALDVRLALEAGKIAEADKKRAEFMAYTEADELRAAPAKTLQIAKWNQERIEEISQDNKALIADKFESADNALELHDYESAAADIGAIAEGAVLQGTQRVWLQTEQKTWLAAARRQAKGEIDPPLKRRPVPPKLPSFPRNDLLPLGGTTVARHLSALNQRLTTLLREGTLKDVPTQYRGGKAVANGNARNSMLQLVVSRRFMKSDNVEETMEYEVTAMLTNLPDDAQLGLLWAAPDKTVADWLGIMHFCFDRGLLDKAGEAALQVRWADPEHQRDLDELLAAKWAKPIPTGGFPERDGKVVPE